MRKLNSKFQIPSSKFLVSSFLFFYLLSFISLLPSFHVQAQQTGQLSQEQMTTDQAPEIIDTSALRAEFKAYTQDPKSKVVRFEMILKSQIKSDRVTVQWAVTGTSRVVDGFKTRTDLSVEPGKTYTIPIEVRTTGFGISEVYGKAEAFQAEGSSIATVRKTYFVNESGEVLPITADYTSKKNMSLVIDILIWIGIAIVAIVGGLIGFRFFVKWFNKDVVKDYEERTTSK